jgi:hypothetical protein
LAQQLQQSSSPSSVVEIQLDGGMALTLNDQNMKDTEGMEGANWDHESDENDEEINSQTRLAYEKQVCVNTEARQSIKFPTTLRHPRAVPTWYCHWVDQSNHGQKEKIKELIRKVNNIRAWQEKEM